MLFLVSLYPTLSVQAQEGEGEGSAVIQQLDTSAFPQISFILDAYHPDGSPVKILSEDSVQVVENENDALPIQQFEIIRPGLQVILAYNLGPAMANVIASGEVRYDAINSYLQDYFSRLPETSPDDFSLATNTGLQAIRLDSPQQLVQEMEDFEPQLMENQPNLTSLLQSLDLATDPNPDPLMKRVILYVTPQLNASNMAAFPGLIDRAVQQDVRVFIWLVAPASIAQTNPTVVEPLQTLAERTGGAFFLYSGREELPDPETYFGPLRTLHRVTYLSQIREGGAQRLQAVVEDRNVTIRSNTLGFRLDISPPNIILLDPTLTIERTWQTAPGERTSQLAPQSQSYSFLVEFPDQKPRDLVRASLYVNDTLVDSQQSAPYDTLTWDLEGWAESGMVDVKVEVEDNLGLVSQSNPLPVELVVPEKPLTFWQALLRLQLSTERWIILASVLTTGAVLVFAVVLAGKRRAFWRRQSAARVRKTDPLTQPVSIKQDVLHGTAGSPNLYPKMNGESVAAWLVPLDDQFMAKRGSAVPLTRQELIIGSDRKQAGLVLPSASIEGVHARLTRAPGNVFRIADNNSVAGTWVNYAPVSTNGVQLSHGDLVHFGKIVYRFELTNPPHTNEPRIISYNEDV